MKFATVYLSLIFVIVFGSISSATILQVPEDYFTIQAAIEASEEGDSVIVSPGTYTEEIDFGAHNITLGSIYLITGDPGHIDQTILEAANESDFVLDFQERVDSTITQVVGFTVRNGYTGIRCTDSSPRLLFLKLESFDNTGVYCDTDSYPYISFCEISDCRDGIRIAESGPIITNCRITNNVNGIIYPCSWGGIVDNCIINNNMITGIGIGAESSSLTTISNCTIYEQGGWAIASHWHVAVINCTIANNNYHEGSLRFTSRALLLNSIIFSNRIETIYADTSNFAGEFSAADLYISHCDIEGGALSVEVVGESSLNWLPGNIEDDPLFIQGPDHPYYLNETSPCIDEGTALFEWFDEMILDLDEDEYVGAAPDMGAVEYDPSYAPDPDDPAVVSFFQIRSVYPNPFNATTSVILNISQPEQVNIRMVDILGRTVIDNPCNHLFRPGAHRILLDADHLPSGNYFIEAFTSSGWHDFQRVTLLK